LVSSFGGNLVLNIESGTHFSGNIQKLLVVVLLVGGISDDGGFLNDAEVHGIEVGVKSLVDGLEVVKVLVKGTREDVESINFTLFCGDESIEGNTDFVEEFSDQVSDSSNGIWDDEFIFFRGSHLGEGDDNWGVVTNQTSLDSGLDEGGGVLGKLDERSFTSGQFVKEFEGTLDDGL